MKRGRIKGLVLNPKDNVGVALADLQPGTELDLKTKGRALSVKLVEPIRYQHKFSVDHIDSGSKIVKFGEVIGKVYVSRYFPPEAIEPGQHVHLHHMVGLRMGATRKGRS